MVIPMRKTTLTFIVLGIVIGVAASLIADEVDHYTSSDAFCGGSCHSMQAYVVNDAVYQHSAHRTSGTGIIAGCADCHMPARGLLAKSWAHVKGGVKDVWAELVNDFQDPKVWEARRTQLAYGVRDAMLADDSANCRSCHDMRKIAVAGEQGQREHARSFADKTTCIQCHYNLVHAPVPARDGFAAMMR